MRFILCMLVWSFLSTPAFASQPNDQTERQRSFAKIPAGGKQEQPEPPYDWTTSPESVLAYSALVRQVEQAARDYATLHGNKFPKQLNSEFMSYFPGGSQGQQPLIIGQPPTNPITFRAEWPAVIDSEMPSVPLKMYGKPGTMEFWSINGNNSFAIRVYGVDGESIYPSKEIWNYRKQVHLFIVGRSNSLTGIDVDPKEIDIKANLQAK